MDARLLDVKSGGPELDVLVVGSGPVGLLAAADLAARGCAVRIVDLNESPVIKTKASGISERSLEILPKSVSDSVMQTSKHVAFMRLLENNGEKMKILGEVGMNKDMRGARGMRSQMQWLTEKTLTEYLEAQPDHLRKGRRMKVERPVELVHFTEVKDGVECELKNCTTGSTERVTAKFLLGCDGGASLVRKGLGFSFLGEATAEYFFALHAHFTGYPGKDDRVDFFFSKGKALYGDGFVFAMPMPDGGYLTTMDLTDRQQKEWLTGEKDRHGMPVLKQPTPEDIVAVMRTRGCGLDLAVVPGTVKWVAHFRVNSRQTNHYGSGRVYLAGDACHCHSPLGGQGMNMGFCDAKNIAWKLAYVAKGVMPPRTLSTYEGERKPVERKILLGIEKAQKMASKRSPVVFFLRGRAQRAVPTLLNFAVEHTDGAAMQYMTQQAWSYGSSSLVFEHWERPRISCPLPNSILARKHQNIFRWLGSRLHAGDSVPEAPAGDSTIQTILKRSRGWTLILFEGSAFHNEEMRLHVPHTRLLSVAELQALGESMKMAPDASGFVAAIDEVVVVPAGAEAQFVFGVRAQCLYLIRPDFHVGLRSEPVRKEAVLQYFDKQCGMKVPAYTPPASSPRVDIVPIIVYLGLIILAVAICASTNFESLPLNVFLGFVSCVFLFLLWASGALYALKSP